MKSSSQDCSGFAAADPPRARECYSARRSREAGMVLEGHGDGGMADYVLQGGRDPSAQ